MLNLTSSQSEEDIGEIKSVFHTLSQLKLLESADQSELDLSQPQEDQELSEPQSPRNFCNSLELKIASLAQLDVPKLERTS